MLKKTQPASWAQWPKWSAPKQTAVEVPPSTSLRLYTDALQPIVNKGGALVTKG